MSVEHVWINGEVLPIADVQISPVDHGILIGDGVFETLRTARGVPFAWSRHAERLRLSASGLGIDEPDTGALYQGCLDVMTANELPEARLRVTVTSGTGPLGSDRGPGPLTCLIAATPLTGFPPSAAVVVVPWVRNERGATAGLKTTSYAENARALAHAKAQGAAEAIFANTKDVLCEGTGSNIFWASDGRLHTPALATGCLAGITRELILEVAAENGIDIDTGDVAVGDLDSADEAFLTSSTRNVQPIDRVNGRSLHDVPGPLTQRLSTLFDELVERTVNP